MTAALRPIGRLVPLIALAALSLLPAAAHATYPGVNGHASFTIPAGTAAKVKVRISKTGMKVLRSKKKLSARASVTSKDGTGVAKSSSTRITLKLAKQRKHHKRKHH